jgi:hypothetical protein
VQQGARCGLQFSLFVSLYVKYNFCYAAVRFESQLLNGGKCQDRQIRDSCAALKSEEKADHVWRGTEWQLASGAWVRSDAAPL